MYRYASVSVLGRVGWLNASGSGGAAFDGHETLWAVAGDITAGEARADVVAECVPAFEVPAEFSGHEALVALESDDAG